MCKLNRKNRGRRIDPCIKNLFNYIDSRYEVVASCCGHGKYPLSIVINCQKIRGKYLEIISQEILPRKRKFYLRDREGYYYIPETLKNVNV